MKRLICVLGLTAGLWAGAASAGEKRVAEAGLPAAWIIHADTPLFGSETEDKWPQAFTDQDGGGFGCASRVAFGDWEVRPADPDDEPYWYRISNYGVFHCWANVAEASERAALDHAAYLPSFFIPLGKAGASELWALQTGAVPGSDYLLLARVPEEGVIKGFTLLQRDCTGRAMRKGRPLDIIDTSYCHVATPADLRRMARQMAKRKPLGMLMLAMDTQADSEVDSQKP